MATQPTVRIGLIGAGGICKDRHLPGLQKIPGVELVAVANRSLASSQAVAREFAIAQPLDDWRKLLERKDIDAVFIGTWPYMHREMATAVLEAGKHVFCQARMAMDLLEARQMLAVAQAHPTLVNMICPPPTRMPFEPYIRKVLAEGQLGQITAVELISVSAANCRRDQVTWRERVEFSGKQVLAMGIFAETLNAWLGPYRTLMAQTATPLPVKDVAGLPVPIAIPQAVTILGQLECGALCSEQHLGLAADKSSPGSNGLTIWGLEGTLRYQFGATIEQAAAGQLLAAVDVPAELCRPWQVEADFIAAVRQAMAGQSWSVSPDFAEGVHYMKKVEAVHMSAACQAAVHLGEL